MNADHRIVIEGASKRYTKYRDAPLLVTRALRRGARSGREDLWALRDVDLAVDPGECLGVIGRNGSGKSTLLRLLAGVTAPTRGRVAVTGRIAPLLAVGVGFHPELTGRENIYVNGIILGLTEAELDRRFDEIVDFAEIHAFIDTPVKFYSSGMFVRLGFSVSILADPDVLLIDEVLAVGDLAFGLKCLDRMQEVRDAGTTLVLVSHNLHSIRLMCDRTVVLHGGEIRHDGDTADAIALYHDLLGEDRELDGPGEAHHAPFQSVDEAGAVTSFALLDAEGRHTGHVRAGEPVTAVLEVEFHRPAADVILGVNVHSESGVELLADSSPWREARRFEAGQRVRFAVGLDTRLTTGTYQVQLTLFTTAGTFVTKVPRPVLFFVQGREQAGGLVDLGARFDVTVDPPGDR